MLQASVREPETEPPAEALPEEPLPVAAGTVAELDLVACVLRGWTTLKAGAAETAAAMRVATRVNFILRVYKERSFQSLQLKKQSIA